MIPLGDSETDLGQENPQGERSPLSPGLYLVATPIGNLEDITLRALRVLRSVDRIACEDTRQTQKLLNHFGIRKPTLSYHLHNEQSRSQELLAALQEGERVAVVSDAGTPGIADPGEALIRSAIDAGVPVFPIPGANAAVSALIGSGFNTERFSFEGFLPAKGGQRRSNLERLRKEVAAGNGNSAATHIFYEAPHRILETLQEIVAIFGSTQQVVVARELTKLHEEFLRGSAASVLETLRARDTVRGEMVVLLDTTSCRVALPTADRTLAEEVAAAMAVGLNEKDALKQVAKSRGVGKSDAYREWQRHKSDSRRSKVPLSSSQSR